MKLHSLSPHAASTSHSNHSSLSDGTWKFILPTKKMFQRQQLCTRFCDAGYLSWATDYSVCSSDSFLMIIHLLFRDFDSDFARICILCQIHYCHFSINANHICFLKSPLNTACHKLFQLCLPCIMQSTIIIWIPWDMNHIYFEEKHVNLKAHLPNWLLLVFRTIYTCMSCHGFWSSKIFFLLKVLLGLKSSPQLKDTFVFLQVTNSSTFFELVKSSNINHTKHWHLFIVSRL